mmetsp:Transcript_7467/g.16331  ORF Transcript_7467/g.16331 Transcript_7467/m.16331 type:complete len:376 (-) Transcript_7467:203-1330(-)
MCLCAVRVQVLRDGDVHHDRLREAGRFEQLVVVNQQLANGVEVGEEATEQTRHFRIGALAIAHLRVLLEAVERQKLVNLEWLEREARELQPKGPVLVALWQRLVEAKGRAVPQLLCEERHQRQRAPHDRIVHAEWRYIPLPPALSEELLLGVDEVGRWRERDVQHGLEEVALDQLVVAVQADDPVAVRATDSEVARVRHATVRRSQHLVLEVLKLFEAPAPPPLQSEHLSSARRGQRLPEHARGRLSALVLRAIINNQDLSGRVTLVHERGERLLQEGHVAKARHDHRDVVRRRREARRTLRHAFGALRKRSQRVASALAEAVQRADCCMRSCQNWKRREQPCLHRKNEHKDRDQSKQQPSKSTPPAIRSGRAHC